MLHYKYRSIILQRNEIKKCNLRDYIEMKIDELNKKMLRPLAIPISSFDMNKQQLEFLRDLLKAIDPHLEYHEGRQEVSIWFFEYGN